MAIPPDATNPRALAREHAAARRRSVRRIRRTVAALAVTLFLATFGGIYVQMVDGHDPALTSSGKSTTTVALMVAMSNATTGLNGPRFTKAAPTVVAVPTSRPMPMAM